MARGPITMVAFEGRESPRGPCAISLRLAGEA